MKAILTSVTLAVLLAMAGYAATNPFSENEIRIEGSTNATPQTEFAAVQRASDGLGKEQLDRAIERLEEANSNYSKLLRKFADDPSKFADENGDYRGFIKQLEALSKRLAELSDKLKKASAQLENESEEKPTASAAKTTEGTVKVGTSLNIRTSPWGSIIGKFHNNDKVKIKEKKGDWYKIDYNGTTAYVHANYIDTPDNKAGTTPVSQPANTSSVPVNNVASTASGGRLTAAPCQPMPSRVSSEFGMRTHPTLGYKKMHNGIDLPIPNGTRLNSLGNGTVVAVGYESGGGKYVKVRYDNGYESFYCHLQSYSVRKGQRVGAGQEIARSDNTGQWTTGAHLHFGLKKNGSYVNPRSAGIPLP